MKQKFGMVISKTILLTLAGFTYLSIFAGCASTGENINTPRGKGPDHRQDLTLAQSEANRTDETVDAQESEEKGKFAKGLGRIVEGPMAGAYVGTAGGNIPTMPGLIGGAAIGAVVGLVTGIQIMITGEDLLDKDTSETLQAEQSTSSGDTTISSIENLRASPDREGFSDLIGNWKGKMVQANTDAEVRIRIEEQVSQGFEGQASVSGGTFSCSGSRVHLTPGSGNSYAVTFSGGGCNGEGKLIHQGEILKGSIGFVQQFSGRPQKVRLSKSE